AAAWLAAAYGARRHHWPPPCRARGDTKQRCRRPVRVPAGPARNRRPVTAVARQPKASKEALSRLPKLDLSELREEWRLLYKTDVSPHLSGELLIRALAYRIQEVAQIGRASCRERG